VITVRTYKCCTAAGRVPGRYSDRGSRTIYTHCYLFKANIVLGRGGSRKEEMFDIRRLRCKEYYYMGCQDFTYSEKLRNILMHAYHAAGNVNGRARSVSEGKS
jgi:hypothetical protein